MIEIKNIIMNYLDPIGIVIGLVLAIPILWTWYDLVWGKRKRLREYSKRARTGTGAIPSILIVDLLDKDKNVAGAARTYAARNEILQHIPEERIVEIKKNKVFTPEDMPDLASDMNKALEQLFAHCTDEVYLFLGCPVFASALVGAELSNAYCKVHLMHKGGAQGEYVDYGPVKYRVS